ncbi:MAG: DEAD/DEAH box helicase, partial [Clostridia bacterium]|nr:DEAD/DEAH box helicase [Clostridia bacterium]
MKYRFISNCFSKLREFKEINASFQNTQFPLVISGVSHIHRVALTAALITKRNIKPLIITAGDAETERVCEDLSYMGLSTAVFPTRDYIFRGGISSSHEYEHQRLGTLSRILEGDFDVCVASADAAISSTIPPETLKKRRFTLSVGQEYDMSSLISKLVSSGYTRSEQVDGAGQFSVRGSIFDIFTPDLLKPVRIDFFGDEIDTISLFETDTQRRTEPLDTVTISPVKEVTPESSDTLIEQLTALLKRKKISEQQKKRISEDIDRLQNGASVAYDTYLRYIYENNSTIFDYFPENSSASFVFDTNSVLEKINGCLKLHSEDIKSLLSEGLLPPDFRSVYLDAGQFASLLSKHNTCFCDSFQKTVYEPAPKGVFTFNLRQSGGFLASVTSLAEDIKNANRKLTVVLAGSEKAANNLCEELCEQGVAATFCPEPSGVGEKGVFITTGTLTEGFELPTANTSVIVHGKSAASLNKRKSFSRENAVGSLEELQIGDYVVHITHGIGIFAGIHQISAHKITRDYIKINYAGKDALYVPVTSLDMVSKYIGSADDVKVKINRLGSGEWNRTRARVKSAVKDMAKQLTTLYAKRMQNQGYAFSPDGDLQSDFESRFEFEETDDQLRCSYEIKRDMERSIPMDRLLCGDVGFGKTEVAFRAAFKCIAEGKQCAILVPTTILAWQHYNNAVERFSNMAVEVEMLSRFRTPKQQEKIRKELKAGNIDLIIGTHSLFSKDIRFKDLGLLIVD